jgi:apolipoprotein N-acyltransferase
MKYLFSSIAQQQHVSNNYTFYGCLSALLAGILLPFAFLPFHAWWIAIISPALLLVAWEQTSPAEGFKRGWWYGLGFFGVGASWVYVSIHQYGDTPAVISGFLTLLFVAILALFPAFQGYLLQRFSADSDGSERSVLLKALLYFPTSWVLIEWMRSWVLTGFPWLQLGHSQVASPLAGFAPLFGVFGVTGIAALLSGLCYLLARQLYQHYQTRGRDGYLKLSAVFSIILVLFCLGFGLKKIHWVTPQPEPVRVALIQGNIPQSLKWSAAEMAHILKLYPQLSKNVWKHHDLVVWPEAAVTLPLPISMGYLKQLLKQIKPYPVSLITGIPVESTRGWKYYNAMILLENGRSDIYYKRYLVPFGEYLPLERWLRGIIGFFNLPMSDFISGAGGEEINLKSKQGLVIAPFVCYEIAYPEAILTTVPHANLMVVLSNDSWFDNSFASWQHLQIAQFAALAAGRYLLVSTNDGITAVIDPKGRVVAQAPRFQQAVLESQVFLTRDNTPWIKFGHNYLLICLGLASIVGRIMQQRKM